MHFVQDRNGGLSAVQLEQGLFWVIDPYGNAVTQGCSKAYFKCGWVSGNGHIEAFNCHKKLVRGRSFVLRKCVNPKSHLSQISFFLCKLMAGVTVLH